MTTIPTLKTGCVLACYGRGFTSGVISYFTPRLRFWRKAPSHVAILALHKAPGEPDGKPRLYVHESTSLGKMRDALTKDKRRGVQAHLFTDWLANYNGRVDLLPLKQELLRPHDTIEYLLEVHDRKVDYDTRAAIRSASPVYNSDGSGPLFCSALAGYALQKGGALGSDKNPAEMTPWDISNLPCFAKPRRLK